LLVDSSRNCADIFTRLVDGYAIFQAGHPIIVMRCAALILAFQAGSKPEVGVFRKSKSRRQDANHRVNLITDFQVSARKVLLRSEVLPPVTVAHERDGGRSLLVITRGEIPAGDRLDSEDREKPRCYGAYAGARRLRASGHRNSYGRVLRDGLKA